MTRKLIPVILISLLLIMCISCIMESNAPPYTFLIVKDKEDYMSASLYRNMFPDSGNVEYPAMIIRAEKNGKIFNDYYCPHSDNNKHVGEIRIMGINGDRYMSLIRNVKFSLTYYKDADSDPITLTDENMYACHDDRYPMFRSVLFDFGTGEVTLSGAVER